MTQVSSAAGDAGDDGEVHRLIGLLRSMNAIHGLDRLGGDFRCLRPESDVSRTLAANEVLRKMLKDILSHCEEGPGDDDAGTLALNFSRAFIVQLKLPVSSWPAKCRRRFFQLSALKAFLRQKDGMESSSVDEDSCNEDASNFFAMESLVRSLPPRVNMVSIDISRNDLDDRDAMNASLAFRGLPSLSELNMSYNLIGCEGAGAIFTVLLGNKLCRIKKLDLQWNWNIRKAQGHRSLQDILLHVLKHQNRSLAELNLAGTSAFSPSSDWARAFYDYSDEGSMFDIPKGYNHHLAVCKIDYANDKKLLSVLMANEGGPEKAMERKIGWHLERHETEIFENDYDPDHAFRCLEFLGTYGSMDMLLKSVQIFVANGSLLSAA